MKGDSAIEVGAVTAEDLQEVRKELKEVSEKLKTLEVRVANVEQNLLGN
ncbi:MAG: hypothetical protein AAB830_01060 [Patescibacteria group bacterium]